LRSCCSAVHIAGYNTTVARPRSEKVGAGATKGRNSGATKDVSLVQNYTSAAELVDHSPGSDFTTSVTVPTIPEFTSDAIDAARLIQELADIHDNNAATMVEAIQNHGSAIAAAEAAQASADLALAKARRLSNCHEGDVAGLVRATANAGASGLAPAPGPRTAGAAEPAGGSSELQLQLKMMEERLLFKLQELARASSAAATQVPSSSSSGEGDGGGEGVSAIVGGDGGASSPET